MRKLTLSAEDSVIEQAKQLAAQRGTSVSAMFERFVRLLAVRRPSGQSVGPIARKATGVISLPSGKSDRQILEEAIAEKHSLQ